MTNVTGIISMLHEPATGNSATRLFRKEPVLSWTLRRLWMCRRLKSIAILCWEDQLPVVQSLADEGETHILAKNPRQAMPLMESVSASRRWADGWRGGLLGTCDFDLGFHAPWVIEAAGRLDSKTVVLVDPSAGLIDPQIIADLVDHARANEDVEFCFTQAPPGLGGVLLKGELLKRLASAQTHPGRVLHYLPDQPMRDPIGGVGCVPIPTAVARTTHNFRLDSYRQIERLAAAAVDLNGELMGSDSEDLLARLKWTSAIDPLPREVVLELNTNRATSPIFWPGRSGSVNRPAMSLDAAQRIFEQLGDDVRLTIAGVGDPILHEQFIPIIELARKCEIQAIHVETDLLPAQPEMLDQLADSGIDILSIHMPAVTPAIYAAVMGQDRLMEVVQNLQRVLTRRQQRTRGVPILVPTFVKCQKNLAEMEAWYDQWLRALNAAVVRGPSDFGGLIPDCGVADMSPPKRRPCSRLASRMSILCDGSVVSCEQDVTGRQVLGNVMSQTLSEIWKSGFEKLRTDHHNGCWGSHALCAGCREWHRP